MIPNTVDATTRPLATTTPIQTGMEGTTTGQQHLRSTIYQTSHQMDARRLWIPGQIDLLKVIKAGNYVGWPMLTECDVQRYYPETTKTKKGHLNQSRKNVRSTKIKATLLETCNTSHLHGKKVCNVYTQMYMVRKTMFSNQTGQFPIQSLCGNKYIMVMVEIDSNAILVEPMKNRKDAEMIWAYNALLL
jgi:hypothetical protein